MNPSIPLKPWPDYRAVWRWHFYAGLICIPFIIWLAVTGSIYLFKPQIEAWLDRPYDHLAIAGQPASAAAEVNAALAALPGATLRDYELPRTPDAAARVIVNRQGEAIRVYVHPQTLQILKTVPEESRLMRMIFKLHGELLIGNTGSVIVELAASWAIIMIITGLYLWWPRQAQGLGGIVYPRLGNSGRVFWRDLHAVTGFWISCFVLFLLLTGLPWAKFWGGYFKEIRQLTGTAVAQQDWTSGAAKSEKAAAMEHMDHSEHMTMSSGNAAQDYSALDRMIAVVRPLNLAPPVLISPPKKNSMNWTARSDAQNRPLRVNLVLDGRTGAILERDDFKDHHPIDRIVGIGIAAHEGQLFGWPNQLLGIVTASSLILLSVSSVVLWWRRRSRGILGAPEPSQQPRFSFGLAIIILMLAAYLPLFAASAVIIKLFEKLVLSRIPAARDWLGLADTAHVSP